jgi:hypothetical protein
MAQRSSILKAFNLLGPAEILKIAHVLVEWTPSLKKVAGDDLVVWDDASVHPQKESAEAKVIPFPERKTESKETQLEPLHHENPASEEESIPIYSSESLLMSREMSHRTQENMTKLKAKKGYQSSSEILMLKSKDLSGKSKTVFAPTKGILVDKKLA